MKNVLNGRVLLYLGLPMAVAALAGCSEPTPPPPPPEAPELPPSPVYTQEMYDKLLYDMTPAQARDILGSESTSQESTYHEGQSEFVQPSLTTWYIWENEDGSYIKLGFVEKKLVEMESKDLPDLGG